MLLLIEAFTNSGSVTGEGVEFVASGNKGTEAN